MNENSTPKGFTKNKPIKLNQNILIFAFFLLISFLFWFFNALSNEYNTEISVPIEYIYPPDSKLVPDAQARDLKVKITALGYRIVNYKTTAFDSVVVDLNHYKPKLVQGFRNKKYYILAQSLKDQIVNSIGKDLRINVIYPDSLIFNVDELVSKKLLVRKNFEISFKKQFLLKNNIKIQPDSILAKGVKSILDTIKEVYTAYDVFKELDGVHTFELDLIKIPGVDYQTKRVNCIVEVEEYTEQNFELPVEVINVPDDIQIKVFPAYAKISANVGFSRYRSIYKDQFRLIVDFNEASGSEAPRLRVKISKSPDHISALRVFPQSVDYIIERK